MRSLKRLISIASIIGKYRLDQLIDTHRLPVLIRFILRCIPFFWRKAPEQSIEWRVRMALEELGPVFVKFGQALSTRRDLLPLALADELAQLQDNVTPFSGEAARALVDQELPLAFDQVFIEFNTQPLAAASIAQVHEAVLQNGDEVVVKVVRPGIQRLIEQDIALMYSLARFAQRFIEESRRLHPVELVEEYEVTIVDELDMAREAANTSQLRRNFIDTDLLYVPEVYFDYTGENIMVMEKIDGIPIGNMAAMQEANINLKVLAERGVEIFFTQVFRDNFFHADMHPGNIFVSREHPEKPTYIGIDCAIIGSLSDFDRYYLARNLLAIFKRDYGEVARLHVECGWVPATTRVADFEGAIRTACEPIFEKPISEIGFAQILLYLFKVARRFDMEVQPSLVLLQKTLLNIEGLGRELYPDLNLWDTAMPYLEKYMAERYAPSGVLKQLKDQAPAWLEQLPQLPDLLLNQLQQQVTPMAKQGNAQIKQLANELTSVKRRQAKIAALTLLAAGVVALLPQASLVQANLPQLAYLAIGAGTILLLRS